MSEEGKGWRGPIGATKCELADTSPPGTPYLNLAVIIVTSIASLLMVVWVYRAIFGSLRLLLELIDVVGSIPCQANLSCWRGSLVAMLIHAGIIHLVGNMMFLYKVGDNVELTLGRIPYLTIYITAGLTGAFVQAVLSLGLWGAKAPLFQVGASAAISGLIGAYIVTYPGSTMCYCLCFYGACYCTRMSAANYFALWIAFQLILAVFNPYVGVFAHFTGLLVGAALTPLLAKRGVIERHRVRLARGDYRGLPPKPEELLKPSISPLAKILMATVALTLAIIGLFATTHLAYIQGAYYQIVNGNSPEEKLPTSWALQSPVPVEARLCRLCKAYAVITPKPLSIDNRYVVYSIHLAHVYQAGLLELGLVALLAIGAFRAMAMYRELEVTYVPPEMEDLRRKVAEWSQRRLQRRKRRLGGEGGE